MKNNNPYLHNELKNFIAAVIVSVACTAGGFWLGRHIGKGEGYWEGDLDGYVSGAMDERFGVGEWPDGEELDRSLYECVQMRTPGLPYPPFEPGEPHELRCLKD